ncbi:hypothetical protein [Chromobacterium sp. IIBBL 290-4]|uniref:hypothetical protein n=1 Tax=Chromobacterium sp. IIBBL 290-4 TaxID=2953890 RepID=UPI0020B8B17F|nr:hypothetical protein [Chromobacterium sp. IIBBL 290-4]UTH76466.1 hypothetical protein NKT35_10335 [Chromobacterium sp. IIBBL 290-4]
MKLVRFAFKAHRYLSYLMFAQLLLWILGGAVFALIPFNSLTKSGAVVSAPKVALPAGWRQSLQALPAEARDIDSFVSARGPAWKAKVGDATLLLDASSGKALPIADAESVSRFARQLYRGEGKLNAMRKIAAGEVRLGMVDELYGQKNVWQASFDDWQRTRLYFDGASGEYLKARNELWVLHDFFWRLHVMDYSAGEDFNNALLRAASLLALAFALSGMVLTWNAARREWGRARQNRLSAKAA